jgi:uncharacterized membrane protein YcfT
MMSRHFLILAPMQSPLFEFGWGYLFLKRIFSLIPGYFFCQWSNLGKMLVIICCMHLFTCILKMFWYSGVLLRPSMLIEWFTGYMPADSAGLLQFFFHSLQPIISLTTDRKVCLFYLFMLPQAVYIDVNC